MILSIDQVLKEIGNIGPQEVTQNISHHYHLCDSAYIYLRRYKDIIDIITTGKIEENDGH